MEPKIRQLQCNLASQLGGIFGGKKKVSSLLLLITSLDF